MSINNDEINSQQLGNSIEPTDNNMHSSLSMPLSEKNEMKNEQSNNFPHSNLQFHHLQESFAAELAQKQKIIEDQQQLLLQLQSSIQELMNGKHEQQHHEPLPQATIYNNLQPNSNLISLPRMESSSAHNRIENNTSKYDNFIEQQILKDKINNIRKFSGNKYDDVNEWLDNIEHDFSSTLVSEEIKLKLIPKSLTNDAENWFEQNKHRLTSWKIFKIEIQHRFQSSLHKDQKFTRLRERKQQLKETGQQFIDAMEKLCFQVNSSMTEQEKMLHIKAGLKPSLKEKVLDKQPESMQQLRNTVKRIEDIETMLNDGNNNEEQIDQQSRSSDFIQPSFPSDFDEPVQYDNNCYALPSHYNNSHYRRNNRRYQHHQQQQEVNQQAYRPNQNYQTRNKSDRLWNQQQPNFQTQSNSYLPPSQSSTNNHSKKY